MDTHFHPSRPPWSIGLANRLNLSTFPPHANQVIAAAAVYQGLFSIISPILSQTLVPDKYANFSPETKINWNVRFTSFVQAVFICAKALHVIFTDPSRPDATASQRLWAYSRQAGDVQAYAAGYFLWDIYVSTRFASQYGSSAAVHGIAALIITMIGFVSAAEFIRRELTKPQRPFANYYGVNFVLYELSTPFLNVHWTLDKLGMTGSKLQLYNGIALMSTFFGCRLVWGSYQTWLLTKDMITAWRSGPVPDLLFGVYLLSNTTLTCLNFWWFGKMVQAMKKRFETKKVD